MAKQLSFPSTLGQEHHRSILAFTAQAPTHRLANLSDQFNIKPQLSSTDSGTVFLYMPALGPVTYEQHFSDEGMGMLEKLLAAALEPGAMSDISGTALKMGGIVGSTLGGEARDKLSTDISNPHTAARYQGPALRKHTFTYQLFPRDLLELQTIRDIVQFFKLQSSTRVIGASSKAGASGVASDLASSDRLQYPSQWLIQEIVPRDTGRIMPTFKFGPAYCESVKISDSDGRTTFITGDSTFYTLELSFVEKGMITATDIEQGM